jgi:hypothetical protein
VTAHDKIRASATVSIWLGEFTTEDGLDEYLKHGFPSDFGFEWTPGSGPEMAAGKREPVRDLLHGFSEWQRFVDRAVELAGAFGRPMASAAVVFYATRYDRALVKNPKAPLQFLGAVEYRGD